MNKRIPDARSHRRRALFFFLDFLGINALFRFINRNGAMILWYHGVCSDDFSLLSGYDERHIQKSLFQKQLNFLRKRGYRFVTMTELMEKMERRESVAKLVVITFDDGFQNVVKNAYPLMRESNAKGCFYLVAGLIGKNDLLWTDQVEMVMRSYPEPRFHLEFEGQSTEYDISTKPFLEVAMKDIKKKLRSVSDKKKKEYLGRFFQKKVQGIPEEFLFSTWEQIKTLDRNILEVGSHTQTHPDCAALASREEFQNELSSSKRAIEEKVGYEVKHFCYPAGSFNNEVIEHVRNSGYWSAVTIIEGFNDGKIDPYRLKRIFVGEDFLLFKAQTSGSYLFISCLLRILKGCG